MLIKDAGLNELTGSILSAAIEVHRVLGPGLLESIYSNCMQYELAARRLRFVSQHPIPLTYKEVKLESFFRVDLVVEETVVVEVKCVESIAAVHKAQVNVPRLVDGVKRLIHPFPRQDRPG